MSTDGRAWTWRHAILDSDLPATTRHVLLTVAILADGDPGTRITSADLSKATGLTQRCVRSHLAAARSGGWSLADRVAYAEDDPWHVLRAQVFATKGAACHYCGKDASVVDHVLPRSRGGRDHIDNLVPSCVRCNVQKGSLTVREWEGLQ